MNNPGAGRRREPLAFTLIEMLVVIAVIAVLIGVLLPVLAASRARARESTCASQLRQIGQAFEMYVQDNGRRPPHIYDLWPRYVTDRRLFVCPSDAWVSQGGWAWSAWGIETTPPEHWPFPVSYLYPWSPITRWDMDPHQSWVDALAAPGRPGYLVCVLHGRRSGDNPVNPGAAPIFQGAVLRLCFDGSVVRKQVHFRGHTLFSTWPLMTDEEVEPP